MPLVAGLKLGPYEIVAPIGAGGMGEVYRARDPRLGRDVAVKVLPAAFARDKERLQRFEHEARAAGALNHPGIVAIYDVGTSDGVPYLVSELLEGESLRTLIQAGAIPARRAAEMTIQAAQALAAAHAKGIVHRDLKPENLHVLVDGRVKVLDFGLAKLAMPDAPPRDETGPQLQSLTMTGTILGTASYMAPEQIREGHVDHRADLFALGAILYELVTGAKAFPGETPADRMTAILTQDPKPLAPAIESSLPGIESLIRRCLEKRADARFDSARDLAFTLQILIAASDSAAPVQAKRGSTSAAPAEARFQQLTYREGTISGARYSSDGRTVVYSAAWGGGPSELYMTRIGSHESRPIGLRDAYLMDVSKSDEIAVRLRSRDMGGFVEVGVLARLPLMGGTPRELIDNVYQAAFGPGGKIAAIRLPGTSMQLEYPLGTVLVETQGWMSDLRVSPDGELVAFVDHPGKGDSGGRAAVVDRTGKVRHLGERYASLWGGAWTPDGREYICSAETDGSNALIAVSLDGAVRSVLRAPTLTAIDDVSMNGDLLLGCVMARMRMEFGTRSGAEIRDLSWLDWTLARDISRDGRQVLFDETGPSVSRSMVFIRGTDGSPAVCLGEGGATCLSPDEKWAMIADQDDRSIVDLVPLGAGESVRHAFHPILGQHSYWFPDGKSLCIIGYEPGHRTRAYRYDLDTRSVSPFTEPGVGRVGGVISPDGKWMWTVGPTGQMILSIDGSGPTRPMPGVPPEVRVTLWSEDGKSVFAFERGTIPAKVFRIDVESGRMEVWMEIRPSRQSGVNGVNSLCLTPDAETYVTSYTQMLSELYTASGLL